MKSRLLIGCLGVMLISTAKAGLDFSYSATKGSIPDGSAVGWSATATTSTTLPTISTVTVNLIISGGYNGDLYAYLSHGGVLVPLLNRVGVGTGTAFGYSNAGMDIKLSDSGSLNVHDVPSPVSGNTYAPDGRIINPLSSPSSFDANGTVGFASFQPLSANGTWTLFLADLSTGAQSQLESWSLQVTAVPEPINVALGVFGVVFGAVTLGRSRQVRSLLRRAVAN